MDLETKIKQKAKALRRSQLQAMKLVDERGATVSTARKLEKMINQQLANIEKTYIRFGTSVVDLDNAKTSLIPKLKKGIEKSLEILIDLIESVEAPPKVKAEAAKIFLKFLTSGADAMAPVPAGLEQLAQDIGQDPNEVLKKQSLYSILQLAFMRDLAPDPDTRRKAANDLLDRAGFGKVVKKDISHAVMIRKDDLEVMKETVNMLKGEGGVWQTEDSR